MSEDQHQGPKVETKAQSDEFGWLDDMDVTGLHYCIGTASHQIREQAGIIQACNKLLLKFTEGL